MSPLAAVSQGNGSADSLARLLRVAKPDTAKVNLLNELAWELKFDQPQAATAYLDSSLALAQKLGFKKGEGNALNFRGVVEDIHGRPEEAVSFFQKALLIREGLGDRPGVASLHNNIGNVMENGGDYLGAFKRYQQSLKIREELRDSSRILRAYYNIANVLEKMADYQESLDYIFRYLEGADTTQDAEGVANAWNIVGNIRTETHRYEEADTAYHKSMELHRRLGNEWQQASALNNIANLNDSKGEERMEAGDSSDSTLMLFQEALRLHEEARQIRLRLEDQAGEAESLNNLGYVLKNIGSFHEKKGDKAAAQKAWLETESYFDRSLKIREALADRAGIMEVFNGKADVRRRQGRLAEALGYTRRYYGIAVEIQDKKFQQSGLKDLARIHYDLGQYQKAYDYRKQYDELRYSTFNEERIKLEERRMAVYTDRKKQQAIEMQDKEIKLQEAQLQTANTIRNSLLGGGLLLLLLAGVLFNRNKIIQREKQRSEDLLLNILPAQTAEELKRNGKAKARRFDAVSVLFTDFKSFTQIAEKTTPESLVAELDECFRAFDEIATRYGIEKIKTIGDAYLCAAGLPVPAADHAERIVEAALDMQAFLVGFRERQRLAGFPEFFCRIGIHTGPVVAGVVGQKKFAYDIWGDTVNMAARMEQSGEPNQVNISASTYEAVKDRFRCQARGMVLAKNKGELEMFFVEGRA